MNFRELLRQEFGPYGELSESQLEALERHHALLTQWNRRLNLTRISDLTETVQLHYCESLFLGRLLPLGPFRVGDLGAGGGFPGIPVGILRPDLQLTLVESDQRKAVFLREAARGIPNIRVEAARFEFSDLRFDWVISRAVTPELVFSSGMAADFAVLMSPESAPAGSTVTLLPWGRSRAAVVFHVKHA